MINNITKQTDDVVSLKGVYKFVFRDAVSNKVTKVKIYENLVPTVARTMIANNLSSTSPTDVMRINYSALGTGTTAPVNADTQLEVETFRKLIASQTNALNVAYFTAFYTAIECNGTYREAGLFANASATINSGILFSRVAINITKSITETLTIDYTITIN